MSEEAEMDDLVTRNFGHYSNELMVWMVFTVIKVPLHCHQCEMSRNVWLPSARK